MVHCQQVGCGSDAVCSDAGRQRANGAAVARRGDDLRHLQGWPRPVDARELAARTGWHDSRRCQATRSLVARLHLSRGSVGGREDPSVRRGRGRWVARLLEVWWLVVCRLYPKNRWVARGIARRGWGGGVVSGWKVGNRADAGFALSTQAADHRG